MGVWNRFVSAVGEAGFIAVLGGLILAMAVGRLVLWEGVNPLSALVATDLLLILPGVVLLYGGYRLSETELHPNVYSRIVARCLAGIGVMLGVVGLLALGTGLNRPVFTPMAGTALGAVAGFAIGLNEARALSRAHEAEEARRKAEQRKEELRQERNLRERIARPARSESLSSIPTVRFRSPTSTPPTSWDSRRMSSPIFGTTSPCSWTPIATEIASVNVYLITSCRRAKQFTTRNGRSLVTMENRSGCR
jgi:hypothetical protein